MFFKNLKNHFAQIVGDIPEEEWLKFSKLFIRKEYPKDTFFIQAGDKNEKFGFIEQGLVRFFFITHEGLEFNQTFKKENEMIMSFFTILADEPSAFSIQALEPSIIHEASFKDFERFYDRHPCWQIVGRKVAEVNFVRKSRREMQLLLYNATQRYLNFQQDFPDLFERLPQYHLASYLGVNPATLNRLIKKLKEQS